MNTENDESLRSGLAAGRDSSQELGERSGEIGRRQFAVALFGLSVLVPTGGGAADIARAGDAVYLTVDRRADLGNAEVLSNYVAIQGMTWNYWDRFESRAWKELRMRTDSVPLLNDEYYFPEGGIRVLRSGTRPSASARGPLGPRRDLWIDATDFASYRATLATRLGMGMDQMGLGLGAMPRTLSYAPASPNWMSMSPADPEEWIAVMREVGRYLAEIGWQQPTIYLFGEYENLFYGKDRPLSSKERALDHAELYILTQRALAESLPHIKLVAPATSTYSRVFTQELQANPDALGIEDWLEATKSLDPGFEPSAIGWQGYYWYGLDGFGPGRLLEGAEHIRGVLRELGFREDIPQYLCGWNGTFGNFEAEDGSMPDDVRLSKEAAHLISSIIDWVEIGAGGAPRISSAHYYTWNLDGPPECEGFPYQSLVSSVHEKMDLGDPLGCDIPASNIACRRATYHAMQFLSDLRAGRLIGVSFGADASEAWSNLRIAAVKKDRTTEILVAQRDNTAIPSINLALQGVSPRKRYKVTVDTIRSSGNACAAIVSSRARRIKADATGTLVTLLPSTGDGIMRVRVAPR